MFREVKYSVESWEPQPYLSNSCKTKKTTKSNKLATFQHAVVPSFVAGKVSFLRQPRGDDSLVLLLGEIHGAPSARWKTVFTWGNCRFLSHGGIGPIGDVFRCPAHKMERFEAAQRRRVQLGSLQRSTHGMGMLRSHLPTPPNCQAYYLLVYIVRVECSEYGAIRPLCIFRQDEAEPQMAQMGSLQQLLLDTSDRRDWRIGPDFLELDVCGGRAVLGLGHQAHGDGICARRIRLLQARPGKIPGPRPRT